MVIGGGAVGLEIGQSMSRFGVQVTVVEPGPRLLGSEEPDVSKLIAKILAREGIEVLTDAEVESAEPAGDHGAALHLACGRTVTADRMLVAAGRRSDLSALGVAALGLDEAAPAIPVDEHLRAAPGVWAVGDVTGKGTFTHVAIYQARICVADILGHAIGESDYPRCPG